MDPIKEIKKLNSISKIALLQTFYAFFYGFIATLYSVIIGIKHLKVKTVPKISPRRET